MVDEYVVYNLSIGATYNVLERPLTQISSLRQYSTLYVSVYNGVR